MLKLCLFAAEFQSVLAVPNRPDGEQLEEHKIERIRNHQFMKMFSQLAVYSGLLYMVYTISYESRDYRSFWLKDQMVTTFKYAESVRPFTIASLIPITINLSV